MRVVIIGSGIGRTKEELLRALGSLLASPANNTQVVLNLIVPKSEASAREEIAKLAAQVKELAPFKLRVCTSDREWRLPLQPILPVGHESPRVTSCSSRRPVQWDFGLK